MVRFRVNIFHVISGVCSILLLVYLWYVFLPSFSNTLEYPAIYNTGLLLTVLLLLVTVVQFGLAVRKDGAEQNEMGKELESLRR